MTMFPGRADLQALPRGVRCEITEDCLRLWWRNWDIRKNYRMGCLLALAWLILTPMTIGMSVAGLEMIRESLLKLTCNATILLPFVLLFGGFILHITKTFLLLLRREGVAVYYDRIELLLSGIVSNRLEAREVLPFEKISRISLGHHPSDSPDSETVPTLNLFVKGYWRGIRGRRILACWMRDNDKAVLFHLLGTVVSPLAPKIEVGPEKL